MSKAAFITGGARRIGRTLCLFLAKQGYDIALHYGRSDQEALELSAVIRSYGQRCEIFQADLQKETSWAALAENVCTVFPALELFVHNASVFEKASFFETDIALFRRQFDINFTAGFFLTQALMTRLKAGHMIHFVDARVTSYPLEHFAYTLSKKVLKDFVLMAAKAGAPRFRVNAIAPGPILPPKDAPRDYMDKAAQRVPLGRIGTLEEVTHALQYLIENTYVTGEMMCVDGGRHL